MGGLFLPQPAYAPTEGPQLRFWQAKRVDRAAARQSLRPDFRVERTRRIDTRTIRVCWSEPGYLGPDDGRDYGCDLIQLRRRQWWIRDDSVIGGLWVRWLQVALDASELAVKTAELMDELDGEYGEEAELVAGLVVVEVRRPHPTEDDKRLNTVHVIQTDESEMSRDVGLCHRAAYTLLTWDPIDE